MRQASVDSEGEWKPPAEEPKVNNLELELFKNLHGHMQANKKLEGGIFKFHTAFERFILRFAKVIEKSYKESFRAREADRTALEDLIESAVECDHLIISQQSKVNLNDFLMSDPNTLFDKFGQDNIIVVLRLTVERRPVHRGRQDPVEGLPIERRVDGLFRFSGAVLGPSGKLPNGTNGQGYGGVRGEG